MTLERGNRFARVWLREVPDLIYPASRTGEREVEAWLPGIAERRLAAVELRLPVGGFVLNGTLGAQFEPEETGRLLVVAAISDQATTRMRLSDLHRADGVRTGLREEFAQAVLDGAVHREEVGSLGPGRLFFNRGSYGAHGSTESLFRRLAAIVVQLLMWYPEFPSEKEMNFIVGL
ncbi:MAG: hypothetical protein HYY18_06815 [Planctomycetes bacterium]|nr:hypothetical protein [Planctomycetota bacterium]